MIACRVSLPLFQGPNSGRLASEISYENVNFEHFWPPIWGSFLDHFWAGNWPKIGAPAGPPPRRLVAQNVTIVSPTGHRPARRGALLGPKTGPKRGHFGGPFSVDSGDFPGWPNSMDFQWIWQFHDFRGFLSFWEILTFLVFLDFILSTWSGSSLDAFPIHTRR